MARAFCIYVLLLLLCRAIDRIYIYIASMEWSQSYLQQITVSGHFIPNDREIPFACTEMLSLETSVVRVFYKNGKNNRNYHSWRYFFMLHVMISLYGTIPKYVTNVVDWNICEHDMKNAEIKIVHCCFHSFM